MTTLWLLRLLLVIVPRVPLGWSYAVADRVASLAWLTSGRLRAVTRDHMRHALPIHAGPSAIDRAARGSVASAARYYVDFARYATLEPADIWQQVAEIRGVPELFRAYDRGCGVVLASAHLGNPEFMGQALRPFFDLAILTEPLEPPALHQLVHDVRGRSGVRFLPLGAGALRSAVAQLRSGGVLGILIDRDVLGQAPPFPFFGERAPMPTGAVDLAWSTGAALVVGFVTRIRGGRYRVVLEEVSVPRRGQGSGERSVDREVAMATVLARVEAQIARSPAQWFPLQPIWGAGRPEGPAAGPAGGPSGDGAS